MISEVAYVLLGIFVGCVGGITLYLKARSAYLKEEDIRICAEKEKTIILESLHAFMHAVSQGVSQKQLYHLILHHSLIGTEGVSACFYEYSPNLKQLKKVAGEGLFSLLKTKVPDHLSRAEILSLVHQGEVFHYGEGIVGEVAQTLRPVVLGVDNIDRYTIHHGDDALRIKHLLISPVFFRDELLGVLAVANSMRDVPFSKNTCHLLELMTQQAGIMLHNIKQLNFQIEKSKLDFDLRLASHVQSFLLPCSDLVQLSHCDFSAYCKPAQQIGGDFYTLFKLDDDRTAFVVADVAGKGIAASLLMTTCVTHLKHCTFLYDSPTAVLKTMNKYLYAETSQEMFVTMAYCILDTHHQILKISRAGHECPLLVKSGLPVQKLMPQGIGLGMVPSEIFDNLLEEATYDFQRGDTCILYTDGVTEALNAQNQEFSQQNLLKVVDENRDKQPKELIQKIVKSVEDFSGSDQLSDDLTLLIFR
ncbi:MAG: SpoIIE family protein phosphatase [Puniceicoccales bacterium]|jgi:sigma-B regulation protein RsbU (phosphoserine phosphatase)|nr:SpoIIE family protein phosphatase [Puniceicoccales bacterium]